MHPEEFKLRPIERDDLAKVLTWRNSEHVRSCMFNDHIISPEEHQAWFERSRQAEFPPVLVFEFRGKPAGMVNFTQIDRLNNRCYWGFYLGETGLPHGCGTIMGFLALSYIFEQQRFRKLCGEAFAFNEKSVSYHKRLGFVQEGHFVKHVLKNGSYEDIISFAMFREDWLKNKTCLASKLFGGEGAK